jgi:hypothetical protein
VRDRVGISGSAGNGRVDGGLIVLLHHLERERRLLAHGADGAHETGLEDVVVGVVVHLAEHHVVGASDRGRERRLVHEPLPALIPDLADERVIAVALRYPGALGRDGLPDELGVRARRAGG